MLLVVFSLYIVSLLSHIFTAINRGFPKLYIQIFVHINYSESCASYGGVWLYNTTSSRVLLPLSTFSITLLTDSGTFLIFPGRIRSVGHLILVASSLQDIIGLSEDGFLHSTTRFQ